MTDTRKDVFERRPGVDSRSVEHDNPTERVDIAAAVSTGSGIALVDTAAGIETEPPTRNIAAALSDEQFFAQPIEIILHAAATDDEHEYCEVTVNGLRHCLRRDGETVHRTTRAHLAVICAAKVQRVVQKKITNSDGSMGYEEKAALQALYPFQLVSDPNPKGAAWLRQQLQKG